jgi:hypothetical protein
MAKNITKKDFFNAIINVVTDASAEGADIDWGSVDLSTKDCTRVEEITSEMVIDFCKREIELLSKKSSSKSNKTSKVAIENEALAKEIDAFLAGKDAVLGKTIAKEFDLSTSKVTAVMKYSKATKDKTKDGVTYTLNVTYNA